MSLNIKKVQIEKRVNVCFFHENYEKKSSKTERTYPLPFISMVEIIGSDHF